ncbi:Myb-like_DNA-binding domain-containing protein [Hexamita inflata]|uniref:Myb-like DNA-binding domain-containing protein n=1 Tax=Hexamita inflata TaxID=28002 RepID=A0AA86PF94_9EUKA|nr:Myb-like DNA-binding domain-containing protein [Hexamita inflata]
MNPIINHYRKWTSEEISKIITQVNQYNGCVINWDKIASQFIGRTAQQCKSYYNDKIKKHSLSKLIQKYNGIENVAQRAIQFLLSANVKEENMAKQFCILNLFNLIQEHVRNAQENNSNYEFNVNVLKLIQSVIQIYKQDFVDQVHSSQALLIDQLNQFINFMNSFDYDELLLTINEFIAMKTTQ